MQLLIAGKDCRAVDFEIYRIFERTQIRLEDADALGSFFGTLKQNVVTATPFRFLGYIEQIKEQRAAQILAIAENGGFT